MVDVSASRRLQSLAATNSSMLFHCCNATVVLYEVLLLPLLCPRHYQEFLDLLLAQAIVLVISETETANLRHRDSLPTMGLFCTLVVAHLSTVGRQHSPFSFSSFQTAHAYFELTVQCQFSNHVCWIPCMETLVCSLTTSLLIEVSSIWWLVHYKHDVQYLSLKGCDLASRDHCWLCQRKTLTKG